ncbi:hypothetical protein Asru_0414_04 [Acidisphaera rubrifaciens HS-AP3]|uniref:Uncharacterized protein n=1 Tax=Acidisphaera rubrifaciens HS-AP3 TaxID=1231350 RepID=A0A0D6P7P2_9PROT|nr:hypothetical protein Asru_0414_04 [Acidisphaera rubrifaciens HS-AP3]
MSSPRHTECASRWEIRHLPDEGRAINDGCAVAIRLAGFYVMRDDAPVAGPFETDEAAQAWLVRGRSSGRPPALRRDPRPGERAPGQ